MAVSSELPMHYWSISELSDAIRRKVVSPVEVTEALLARIDGADGALSAYATVVSERALEQATVREAEIMRGRWRGPLHGVPVAVKDIIFTAYAPTASGMPIYTDFVPGHSATVVERLEQAGGVILGKLVTAEGAFSEHHPRMRTPRNPWNADYWTGASSSGPGVGVAAGLCFGALGSDTGGSIRFPSLACGVTGLKPTWGRVSRHGVFPLAPSLDHIGPMARTAEDAAIILATIAGRDEHDASSLRDGVQDYVSECAQNIRGVRIGIDPAYAYEGAAESVTAAIEEAARTFGSIGAVIKRTELVGYAHAVRAWEVFIAVEAALVHQAAYSAQASDYGSRLAALIEQGRATSAAQVAAELLQRPIFAQHLAAVFHEVDVLLTPVLGMEVPTVSKWSGLGDKDSSVVKFMAPFDLSGSPTITIPCGIDTNGLPIAAQLIGPGLSEGFLCRLGAAFQRATDWHIRRPPEPRSV